MRELRRYNLERTFVHQFRTMAVRSAAFSSPRQAGRGGGSFRGNGGSGVLWRFVRPRRIPGLAAVKHAERLARRQALTEAWLERREMTRLATGKPAATMPARPAVRSERSGPMSRGELYRWHKAMGTLEMFFAMFPV